MLKALPPNSLKEKDFKNLKHHAENVQHSKECDTESDEELSLLESDMFVGKRID